MLTTKVKHTSKFYEVRMIQISDTSVLFTLAEVLAAYVEETEVVKELREKLAGAQRDFVYDMEKDEDFIERESTALAQEFGLSEKATVCLGIDMSFYAVKKTGDIMMGEMNKLCMGLEKFKNAVESGHDIEKAIDEVTRECGLEDC